MKLTETDQGSYIYNGKFLVLFFNIFIIVRVGHPLVFVSPQQEPHSWSCQAKIDVFFHRRCDNEWRKGSKANCQSNLFPKIKTKNNEIKAQQSVKNI